MLLNLLYTQNHWFSYQIYFLHYLLLYNFCSIIKKILLTWVVIGQCLSEVTDDHRV